MPQKTTVAHKSGFLNKKRHSKLFKDDDVNECVNEQIKKVSENLDEKFK